MVNAERPPNSTGSTVVTVTSRVRIRFRFRAQANVQILGRQEVLAKQLAGDGCALPCSLSRYATQDEIESMDCT